MTAVARTARRLTRISLRARLLAIAMVLLVAGLVVSNLLVIGALRGHLEKRVDEQVRPLATAFSRLPPQVVPPDRTLSRGLTGRSDLLTDLYVAHLTQDGTIDAVLRTTESGRPRLPRLDPAAVAARDGRPFEVAGRGGGDRWRVVALRHASGGSVVVAASLHGVDATIGRLRADCALIGVGVLVLLGTAGWFAVRAGLRPLHRIEATAAAIAGGDLSHRIPDLAAPGTEVGRLSAALNGMLTQLETAFDARAGSEARMRRFVADASHELRTPLSGIKGFAELYRMGGLPERSDVDRTMLRIESEATRLARLVEDLLLLARLDGHHGSGDLPLHPAPMDMRTLAADALHDVRALDPGRPVRLTGLDGGPSTTAPVLGDESRLRQAVTNLVGNAVTHTPPGTPVRITVGTEGTEAVLTVEDDGPGLTGEQASMVFERFYRADASRTRTGEGGAGLGLAIVASVVAAHDGRVELRTAPGEGAVFRMVLPAALLDDTA
ncbi:HAMP domain-containing sensor histidine kinase [Actinoallomurus bryophytorum]|uniref:histidine kinase n=1 Tax=Actinoallomurus bryophytorum TaxID=1490222 RepID=A0A543CPR6_9ACTN|nr:HAMP domain-containing sensor histidine kinase [Actinoallomurus bryophytorum]TQL99101.1 two-component system OmpR family sensor kinase [Actinoallomurus bryophytorum]